MSLAGLRFCTALQRSSEPVKAQRRKTATLALVAAFITGSGRSAWFVGVLLIMVYAVFAITLYLWPPPVQ